MLRGDESRMIVWDEEAGTVSGTHSVLARVRRALDTPKAVEAGVVGRVWSLGDPAEFLVLLHIAYWRAPSVRRGRIRFVTPHRSDCSGSQGRCIRSVWHCATVFPEQRHPPGLRDISRRIAARVARTVPRRTLKFRLPWKTSERLHGASGSGPWFVGCPVRTSHVLWVEGKLASYFADRIRKSDRLLAWHLLGVSLTVSTMLRPGQSPCTASRGRRPMATLPPSQMLLNLGILRLVWIYPVTSPS